MKLHHVGIVVQDIESALARYEPLGFKETQRGIVEAFNVAISMISDGDVTKLELLQPLGEGGVQSFLEKNGEGMHHIAYEVPNIEAKLDELRAAGVQLIDEVPRSGFGGHQIAFLHPKSFGGVLIELVQAG